MSRSFLSLSFLLLTLFRVYFAGKFDLTPDETYYWYWSEHLHLSYFDHPPMIAWMIKLSTSLFGQKEWAVRLPAILMGVGDTFLIYLLAKKVFKTREAGLYSAIILNSLLIFSVGMVIITPDSPQLFFWILTICSAYNATIENRPNSWFLTGVFLGLGLLSKYTMILFLPAAFFFLLMSPPFRNHLTSWKLWISLMIAFLIFSPVIIWNSQNHWESFLFQIRHGTSSRESPGLRYFFEFLGGQAAIFSPFIFFGFFWSLWKGYKIGRKTNLYQFSFFFWMVFPLFLFFIYESFHTKIEANWPVFSQTGSIVLLGGFFYQKMRDRKDSLPIQFSILFSIGLSILMMAAVHLQAFTKFIPLRVETDRTNDLIGWSQLKEVYRTIPESAGWPVLTTSHTLVGETSFYLKNNKTYQSGAPFRITDLSRAEPGPLIGKSFLLISFDDDSFSNETRSLFKKMTSITDIPVYVRKGNSKIRIRTYHLFKGEQFIGLPSAGAA